MNIDRWFRLMADFGFNDNETMFRSLVFAYSEKHRHYHTMEHVADCLGHLDSCLAQVNEPREVEIALWFHDAIYNPLSSKNVRKSADLAASFLSTNSATDDLVARVYGLIMITEYNVPARVRDESIMLDIDLAILGSDAETYIAFEQAVRKEYRIIPNIFYRKKRVAVLRGFVDRPFIYQNEPFKSEREQQAKVNLTNAIYNLIGPL